MDMKIHNHGSIIIWCAAILALLPVCGVAATKDMKDVDLDALIRETERLARGTDELTLVWWIPEEFWSAGLAQDPTMAFATEIEKKALNEVLLRRIHEYTMIVVRDGTLDAFGEATFRPEHAIREDIRIIDLQGRTYAPLPAGEIDADIKDLIQSLELSVAELAGHMGENTHILLFPCKTETGARMAEATETGQLKIILGDREFRWRLPLDSVLLGRVCNGCMEECKGSWKFCPWCGRELVEQ